jgi:hypothetical protein
VPLEPKLREQAIAKDVLELPCGGETSGLVQSRLGPKSFEQYPEGTLEPAVTEIVKLRAFCGLIQQRIRIELRGFDKPRPLRKRKRRVHQIDETSAAWRVVRSAFDSLFLRPGPRCGYKCANCREGPAYILGWAGKDRRNAP